MMAPLTWQETMPGQWEAFPERPDLCTTLLVWCEDPEAEAGSITYRWAWRVWIVDDALPLGHHEESGGADTRRQAQREAVTAYRHATPHRLT